MMHVLVVAVAGLGNLGVARQRAEARQRQKHATAGMGPNC